ncbi:MAG: DUF4097 family beta strand repeat-containing protein [Bacteroidota bacterium]
MNRISCTLLAILLPTVLLLGEKKKEFDRTIPTKPTDRIELRGFSSSKIDFKSWDKNEIRINIRVSVESSNESYMEEYIRNVDLMSTDREGVVVVTFKQPDMSGRTGFSWSNLFKLKFSSWNSVDVAGEIYLPRSNPLFLEVRYSSISLEEMHGELSLDGKSSTISLKNCGALRSIDNDYGTTTVEQSGGNLQLKSTSSRITIDTFDGSVDLDADYSTVQLRDIKKGATIKSKSSSNITVEGVAEDLTLHSDYSTLRISDVKGFVTLDDKSGNIKVNRVGGIRVQAPYTHIDISDVTGKSNKPIQIESSSGRVSLENITGDISIESPYSPIELTNIRGNVEITAKSGSIRFDDVIGDVKATTEYTSFSFRDVTANSIVITDKSSSVDLSLKNIPSTIDIRNEYGNVKLRLPKDYSADANLKVSYGTIKCNKPLGVEEVGGGAYFVGRIGGGTKNSLKVQTSSGDINLRLD